jgi:hypothetical protein
VLFLKDFFSCFSSFFSTIFSFLKLVFNFWQIARLHEFFSHHILLYDAIHGWMTGWMDRWKASFCAQRPLP